MKKFLLSFLTLTVFGIVAKAQNVNIPDYRFKNYLLDNAAINTNGDDEIQVNEATSFAGTIDISSKNISDITGIEAFTALTYLNAYYNNLTTLDVSQNTALTTLLLGSNKLKAIDITKNTALKVFNCSRNMLTTIDIAQNSALENLECSANMLSAIDVSKNVALIGLNCTQTNISSLDVTSNPLLEFLMCGMNNLTILDVTNNFALTTIDFQVNNITEIDVTNNLALGSLNCRANAITTLDLTQNLALTSLTCSDNSITSLDISQMPRFYYIRCSNNALTYLNVANGMNKNFYSYEFINNPDLECIQVDDVAWSNLYWKNYHDSTATFSTDCGSAVGTVNQKRISNLTIFPNPSNNQITIKTSEKLIDANYIVMNLMGQTVLSGEINNENSSLDISNLASGNYFIQIQSKESNSVSRFIKE